MKQLNNTYYIVSVDKDKRRIYDAVCCYLMSPFFLTHRSPVSLVAVSSSPPVVAVAPRVQKLHSVTASSMAPLPAPVSISSPSASN